MFELQQNTAAAELDFIRSVAKVFRSIESRKDFFLVINLRTLRSALTIQQ